MKTLKVTRSTLTMLAANRHLVRPGPFEPRRVTFDACRARRRVRG